MSENQTKNALLESKRLSVSEVAEALRVDVSLVQAWIREGRLPVLALSRRKRFVLASDLEAFIAAGYVGGAK